MNAMAALDLPVWCVNLPGAIRKSPSLARGIPVSKDRPVGECSVSWEVRRRSVGTMGAIIKRNAQERTSVNPLGMGFLNLIDYRNPMKRTEEIGPARQGRWDAATATKVSERR